MRRQDEEDNAWEAAGDNALAEGADIHRHSLLRRISLQRAMYFADIREDEGGPDDEDFADGSWNGKAGNSMGRLNSPGAGSQPAGQGSQASGFADLSTWYCDAFVSERRLAYGPSHSEQQVQGAQPLLAVADQPTSAMPALTPEAAHIADQPTLPMVVVVGRARSRRTRARSGPLARLCPGFLHVWLRSFTFKRGPRLRQAPVPKGEQRAKQAARAQKPPIAATHDHQLQLASQPEQTRKPAALEPAARKQKRGEQEQVGPVDKAHMTEKAKLDAKAEQEANVRKPEKRTSAKKGSQMLLERLREREQRGSMPRTLTPPVLRPARIPRPPTDNLFGK